MGISEEKMKIVINNYFKSECNVNTSIREAFEKGFRIGVKKGLAQSKADTPQTDEIGDCNSCEYLGDLRCGMCTNGSGYRRRADTPQTDLLVKTPHKSRESHEKNCEACRDKDAYDEWQGNCDECENGSMYTPQTDCDTCRHYKLACELFSEICKYEPKADTPQTERSV